MKSIYSDWTTPKYNGVSARDCDFNRDGVVDLLDITQLIVNFTETPRVSGVTINPATNITAGSTINITGTATTDPPWYGPNDKTYRIMANVIGPGGISVWLANTPELNTDNFSARYTPPTHGTYTVTLHARSYVETYAKTGTSVSPEKAFTVAPAPELNGVFRVRNGTSNFLTVDGGRNLVDRDFISALRANGTGELAQNMRIRYYPAYDAYTIAAISSSNGFTRVMAAANLANDQPLRVTSRTFANTQLFTITDAGSGQYYIRPKSNQNLALALRSDNAVRLTTYNSTSANQKWYLDSNADYNKQEKYYNDRNWAWPVPSSTNNSCCYGFRAAGWHDGADISGASQTPITSTCAGTVERVDYEDDTYGHYILITSNDNAYNSATKLRVRYSHLFEVPKRANGNELSAGNSVTRGEQIGKMGSTGSSTGTHLDLKVHISGNLLSDGTTTNPYQFFFYMRDSITDTQGLT